MSVEIPDYNDARGRTNAAVISVFLVLASITVALRIYVRAFITRNLALDDLFLVSSQVVTNIGAGICAYIDASQGKYRPSSKELWNAYGTVSPFSLHSRHGQTLMNHSDRSSSLRQLVGEQRQFCSNSLSRVGFCA